MSGELYVWLKKKIKILSSWSREAWRMSRLILRRKESLSIIVAHYVSEIRRLMEDLF